MDDEEVYCLLITNLAGHIEVALTGWHPTRGGMGAPFTYPIASHQLILGLHLPREGRMATLNRACSKLLHLVIKFSVALIVVEAVQNRKLKGRIPGCMITRQ